jgi:hypothetical protein
MTGTEGNPEEESRKQGQRADLLLILSVAVVIVVGLLVIFFP